MDRLPSEEEFKGWLMNPVTQCVFRRLPAQKIKELQAAWGRGAFTFPTIEACALKNAEKIAEVNVWSQIMDLDYMQLTTELGADEDERCNWDAGGESSVETTE